MSYGFVGDERGEEFVPYKNCPPVRDTHRISFRDELSNNLMYFIFRYGFNCTAEDLKEILRPYSDDDLKKLLITNKYDYSIILQELFS